MRPFCTPFAAQALVLYDRVSTAAHSCDPNVEVVVLFKLQNDKDLKAQVHHTAPRAEDLDFDDPEAAAAYERYQQAATTATVQKGDTFNTNYAGLEFRAIKPIREGDEITFSYCLEKRDLEKDFAHRRRSLNRRNWTFVCHCDRCVAEARAFLDQKRAFREGRLDDDDDDDDDGGGELAGDVDVTALALGAGIDDY